MKLLLTLIITFVLFVAGCSTETISTRGKYLSDEGAGGETTGTDDGSTGAGGTEDQLTLSLTDLYLFLADDLQGKIDSKIANLDGTDLQAADQEVLNDNGLTSKLIPLFIGKADQDGSGDLSFAEFLDGTVEKNEQEDAVKAAVESDKQTVYDRVVVNNPSGDFSPPFDATDILYLVKLRVWVLRNWIPELQATDPDRLKLLVKTGYDDLHALVASTYNAGELETANYDLLVAGITAELSK